MARAAGDRNVKGLGTANIMQMSRAPPGGPYAGIKMQRLADGEQGGLPDLMHNRGTVEQQLFSLQRTLCK